MSRAVSLTVALLLIAGTALADETLSGDILFASQMCNTPDKDPKLTLINDQQTLEQVYAQFQSNTLGAKHPVPNMNFERDTLLLIEMGEKPTGGYQVAYNYRQPIKQMKDHLAVTVNWLEPDANTITVQMVTSPCVLIRLPKGDYPVIRIYDPNGQLRIDNSR